MSQQDSEERLADIREGLDLVEHPRAQHGLSASIVEKSAALTLAKEHVPWLLTELSASRERVRELQGELARQGKMLMMVEASEAARMEHIAELQHVGAEVERACNAGMRLDLPAREIVGRIRQALASKAPEVTLLDKRVDDDLFFPAFLTVRDVNALSNDSRAFDEHPPTLRAVLAKSTSELMQVRNFGRVGVEHVENLRAWLQSRASVSDRAPSGEDPGTAPSVLHRVFPESEPMTGDERREFRALNRAASERERGSLPAAQCPKVPHVGDGHLHDANDDSPFDVDGVAYCGRCHALWPHVPASSSENARAPQERV